MTRTMRRRLARLSTEPNVLTTNAPATAAGLAAALGAFLAELVEWGLSSLPDSVPDGVVGSAMVLALAVIGLIGVAVGRIAQRWTYPEVLDPALLELGAEPLPPIPGADEARRIVPRLGDVPDIDPPDER